jgi:hypothetical protein
MLKLSSYLATFYVGAIVTLKVVNKITTNSKFNQ